QGHERTDISCGFGCDAAFAEQVDRNATGCLCDGIVADKAAAARWSNFGSDRCPRVQRLLHLDLVVVAAVGLAVGCPTPDVRRTPFPVFEERAVLHRAEIAVEAQCNAPHVTIRTARPITKVRKAAIEENTVRCGSRGMRQL